MSILEPQVQRGVVSEAESLLCGVLLLLPPLADYEAASDIFSGLLTTPSSFEAAVWDAYRYSVLLPDGDVSFERILRSHSDSAVASHMLSMVARTRGDYSTALAENRRSRLVRLFPFNLSEALKSDSDLSAKARSRYWRVLSDLLVSRTAETDEGVYTVEGMLQQYWDNLILGTRITSELWNEYQNTISH
ncbi:MAG: hypothetical protein GKR94_14160 [Gammaproteobacteria bacterium]|nr:hypothetical protein [Gammaproteobacteria bacterium]